jgi:hypothetical protein
MDGKGQSNMDNTTFSRGYSIFPRKISSFFFGKIEIQWKNGVPKLALRNYFQKQLFLTDTT